MPENSYGVTLITILQTRCGCERRDENVWTFPPLNRIVLPLKTPINLMPNNGTLDGPTPVRNFQLVRVRWNRLLDSPICYAYYEEIA